MLLHVQLQVLEAGVTPVFGYTDPFVCGCRRNTALGHPGDAGNQQEAVVDQGAGMYVLARALLFGWPEAACCVLCPLPFVLSPWETQTING